MAHNPALERIDSLASEASQTIVWRASRGRDSSAASRSKHRAFSKAGARRAAREMGAGAMAGRLGRMPHHPQVRGPGV